MHSYRDHRYNTCFPVTLQTAAGICQGTVLDINEAGAKISGLSGVRVGSRIVIPCRDMKANALVRWVTDDIVGVVFQPQISLIMVDVMRTTVRQNGPNHGPRHCPPSQAYS